MRSSTDIESKLDVPPTDPLLETSSPRQKQPKVRSRSLILLALIFSCTINIAVFVHSLQDSHTGLFPGYYYSPVEELLTLHPRLFTTGLGNDTSAYQGPPYSSKGSAWKALYRKFLRIPSNQAAKLNNKTVPLPQTQPDQPKNEDYGIGLMVFHNLHCLHFISEALDVLHYPSYFGLNASFNPFDGVHSKADFAKDETIPDAFLDTLHTEHCIDLLRQALMCNADITPYVFVEGKPGSGRIGTSVAGVHMCADFNALRAWAAVREFDGDLQGADASKAMGRCGAQDAGCGEDEFGEGQWRAENRWMNSDVWI